MCEKLAGKEPEPFDKVDPMTCVAQGAAIVSAILQQAPGLDNYAYSVKLEHSLCANPVNERRQVYLDPIIKRGADIPCSFTKMYYPVADPAERVVISVYEGDMYDDPESGENVKLAEIPWEFTPPRTQRDCGLEVTYEYGDDGILTVQIHDIHGRHKKRFAIQQAGEDQMDAQQIMKMKRINEELVNKSAALESTPEYKEAVEVLKKTEQDIIPKLEKADDKQGAGGTVPSGAPGDGQRRPQADGGGGGGAERSVVELCVFAVISFSRRRAAEARGCFPRSRCASRLNGRELPCSFAPCARNRCPSRRGSARLAAAICRCWSITTTIYRPASSAPRSARAPANSARPSGNTCRCWRSIPIIRQRSRQVSQVVTAVRQFDQAARRVMLDRMRRRERFRRWVDSTVYTGESRPWLLLLLAGLLVLAAAAGGFWAGYQVGQQPADVSTQ